MPGSLIDTFLLIVEPFSTPILKKTTHQGNIKLVNKNYSKILEVKNSKEYITLAHNVKEEVSNPLLRCKVFKEIFCLKLLLLLVFELPSWYLLALSLLLTVRYFCIHHYNKK